MEVPRIQIPTVRSIEVPIIRNIEPPIIPAQPVTRTLRPPIIHVPGGEVPSYEPIDAPTQEEWEEMIEEDKKPQQQEKPAAETPPLDTRELNLPSPPIPEPKSETETPVIELPVVGDIPVPPKETVILAGTTATASVAAALAGKALLEQLLKVFKPIVKQLFVRGKKLLNKDLTPYEEQLMFSMELDKKTRKALVSEAAAEKRRQAEEWEQLQQRRNKR
jgi:hypothetical protein